MCVCVCVSHRMLLKFQSVDYLSYGQSNECLLSRKPLFKVVRHAIVHLSILAFPLFIGIYINNNAPIYLNAYILSEQPYYYSRNSSRSYFQFKTILWNKTIVVFILIVSTTEYVNAHTRTHTDGVILYFRMKKNIYCIYFMFVYI